MKDPFDAAIPHHLTVERFVATSVRTRIETRWRIIEVDVECDEPTAFEIMFRIDDESPESHFQFWCGPHTGVADGLLQMHLDERSLRIALDAEHGAALGFLSNLFVFELPEDPHARVELNELLNWARDQQRWDIRLRSA